MPELDPEDAKFVTLARGARLRAHVPHSGAAEGAAVRDADGRTYAAATVENADPALTTSALRAAVAAAASSGARAFEAAVVVGGRWCPRPTSRCCASSASACPCSSPADDGSVHHTVTT